MREITILSGKGGTGKTSITAALASVAQNAIFCDNDVDAADLHLIFEPQNTEKYTFLSGWKANIDTGKCTACNLCIDYCRFDAIYSTGYKLLKINAFKCEGCRLCEKVCPAGAITSNRGSNNYWYVSSTRFGTLVHARMGPGEENSGKLVMQIRKRAKEIAIEDKLSFIINDGPPGIGCATISSLSGTNLALIVIEPTKSGLHDAQRLVDLIGAFNIEVYAIINKYNLSPGMAINIEAYLKTNKIPLIAKVPFDKQVVQAMIAGKTIVEFNPGSGISNIIREIWKTLKA